ncbi:MAG: 1,4-alpha-glucan branching protein domain-containing protein [Chloroflexota bacterium]
MRAGAFTFVLHSHLPYCRNAGHWPHGEEWIHEAASETYIPLLNILYDLVGENVPFKLTISLTPVLVEQLTDPLIRSHLDEFLKDKLNRARSDTVRFRTTGDEHRTYLAHLYQDRYQRLIDSYRERFGGDIVAAFRRLQDDGYIEIIASAATHAYLPLLARDSSIYGQLKAGFDSYRRHFGRDASTVWLPECGYRPGFYLKHQGCDYLKPGIEVFLNEIGLKCFFAETHAIEGGQPVGKATGEVIGPYSSIPRRYYLPVGEYAPPTLRTTCLPYYVQDTRVAVIGRNNRTGMQVWSADWGYPGDFNYREFHKKDGVSGLQYWKVTGANVDLGFKEYYEPFHAQQRVAEHSAHFTTLVEQLLVEFYQQSGRFGIISAAYDTELFGHWWFEGIDWLRQVLERLARSELVELTTASEFIRQRPPEDVMTLPESSWGTGGGHFTWSNVDTEWIWPVINAAEVTMEELVKKHVDARGPVRDILNQAARELLLLQSSDWPFLITTGQAREYATRRFQEHVERFNELAKAAGSGNLSDAAIAHCRQLRELDNLFPDINYRVFMNRESYLKL